MSPFLIRSKLQLLGALENATEIEKLNLRRDDMAELLKQLRTDDSGKPNFTPAIVVCFGCHFYLSF